MDQNHIRNVETLQTVVKQESYDCIQLHSEQSSNNAVERAQVDCDSNSSNFLKSDYESILSVVSFEDKIKIEPALTAVIESNEWISADQFIEENNLNVNDDERNFKCTVCNKSFKKGNTLKVHMATHTGVKPYSCNLCDKSYTVKYNLDTHMANHTGERMHNNQNGNADEKNFKCTVCNKGFKRFNTLKVHMVIHTGVKPYSCNICGKSYTVKYNLNTHMGNHTGERTNYGCEMCNKVFKTNYRLMTHMRIHSGERPYACEICGHGFIDSTNLKFHVMRKHTGERPFACEMCDKSFVSSSTLKFHMRRHAGEQPFSCEICEKRFSDTRSVKVHMKTHEILHEQVKTNHDLGIHEEILSDQSLSETHSNSVSHEIKLNEVDNDKANVRLECGDCGRFFTDPNNTDHVCFS